MKSLTQYINEQRVNEGAGAGYTMYFEGLKIKDVKLVGKNDILKDGRHQYEIRRFDATLDKTVLDKWSAIGYYDGVTSEGVEYDGKVVQEYDKEDRTVEGGTIRGYVYLDDVEPNSNNRKSDNVMDTTDEDIIKYIKENLSDFKVEKMYGGGYIHSNLTNPIVLKDFEIDSNYDVIVVEEIKIQAPNITKNVNWFFAHCDEFEDMFGDNAE